MYFGELKKSFYNNLNSLFHIFEIKKYNKKLLSTMIS